MKSLLFNCGLIVCLFISGLCTAQSFKYKAELGLVNADSFYKIKMVPEIVAKSKPGLADLRIKDGDGNIVPYFIQKQQPVFTEASFVNFPIIKNTRGADKQTHFVIENTNEKPVNELLLEIKNTDARRFVTVSGSDDREKFYVISENILLQNLLSEKGSVVQTLQFPASRYKYFQITILGEDVLPVNIIRAGIYTKKYVAGGYEQLPRPLITQFDSSNNKSYVYLTFSQNYQSDKIDLDLTGSKFFKRNLEIKDAENNGESFFHTLIPENTNGLQLNLKTKKILLIIDNEDNPPMVVTDARLWQLSESAVAYLQKDKKYTLFFGDEKATTPKYDLLSFADTAAGNFIHIEPKIVQTIPPTIAPVPEKSYISTTILWIIIIATLVILLAVTLSLTGKVKDRKGSE